MKQMREKKAAGGDDVPGGVLNLLGEGGLRIMTKLINNSRRVAKGFLYS
jgi:hypothetical protein